MISNIPAEIWQRIFGFLAIEEEGARYDYAEDWLSARQTCKTWHLNILDAWRTSILQDARRCSIRCGHPIDSFYDASRRRRAKFMTEQEQPLKLKLVFDRIDEQDDNRCVFKETEESKVLPEDFKPGSTEQFEECKYSCWENSLECYYDLGSPAPERVTNYHEAPYAVVVDGFVINSLLPDLRFDIEKRELSFVWEKMLHNFFLERAEMCRRIRAASKAFAKKQKAVRGPLIRVEDMNIAFFALVAKTARASRFKILRDVRRERIRRHCKADPAWQNLNHESYPDDRDLQQEKSLIQKYRADTGFSER